MGVSLAVPPPREITWLQDVYVRSVYFSISFKYEGIHRVPDRHSWNMVVCIFVNIVDMERSEIQK